MAEDQNKDEKKTDNKENDPYGFFKFAGPRESNDKNDNNDDKDKKGKRKKIPFWVILIAGVLIFTLIDLLFISRSDNLTKFSDFRALVAAGEITEVEIGEDYIIGYGRPESVNSSNTKGFQILPGNKSTRKEYKTTAVLMSSFIDLLDEKGVQYEFIKKKNNFFLQLLMNLLFPIGLIFLMYFFFFRKMGGGSGGGGMGSIFSVGNSKAKVIEEGKITTRFSDVAGVDEAKEELVEVVDFLKEPKKYTDIGGKIPKGVLLVGPPGTGKTLLARAVAGEAGVPFFRISGSDFVEMFVGVGASRVRDLFKQAREKAPCIIFIDELDAIGKSRVNNYGGNDEREQTLNQLLVEMDGFDNEKGLIILAATNRADILDAALLRPGRFDRQVPVERPDVKGREEILRIHAKNVKLEDDVDFDSLAHGTTGFAGADLANVVNEAALLAVRNGRKRVTMEDFNDAIDKVSIGLKKKTRSENEKERRLVAFHETGHALVGAFTPDYPPVNKITVVPRSHGVGGFTQYREEEEKNLKTKSDLLNEVSVLLGGRAAEQVMFGEVSTGASNDISRATDILKSMIVDYGMSDKFENMTLGKGVRGYSGGEPELIREFSEETQRYIDEEIARIMKEKYTAVVKLLDSHKELLQYIATRIMEKETMDGKEFAEIVKAEGHCKALEGKSATIALGDSTADTASKNEETSKDESASNQPNIDSNTEEDK